MEKISPQLAQHATRCGYCHEDSDQGTACACGSWVCRACALEFGGACPTYGCGSRTLTRSMKLPPPLLGARYSFAVTGPEPVRIESPDALIRCGELDGASAHSTALGSVLTVEGLPWREHGQDSYRWVVTSMIGLWTFYPPA